MNTNLVPFITSLANLAAGTPEHGHGVIPTWTRPLASLASLVAAIAAITRTIPLIVQYRSARKTSAYNTDRLRVTQIAKKAPWEDHNFPSLWKDENFRRRYWRDKRQVYALFAIFFVGSAASLLILWPKATIYHDAPSVIYFFIFVIFAAVYGLKCLATLYYIGSKPYKKCSPLRRDISFTVAGSKEDILQHSYLALQLVGAKIVKLDEKQGIVEASTGLWIRHLYSGQQLLVSLKSDQCEPERFTLTMSSDEPFPYKLSYLVFPHRRNVERFFRQWTFTKDLAGTGAGEREKS